MLALFTAFILFLQHVSLISAATSTPFVPALKTWEESGQAMIRGLIELSNRQSYYCPAPSYTCVYPYCCRNSQWQCCRDGSCCRPNYYCSLASNGIMGCCPDGEICSGPVDDPTTSTIYYTTTSTSTSTSTSAFTNSTFGLDSSPTRDTTTTRRTTTSTPSTFSISISSLGPLTTPTSIQNISNGAIGLTGNAVFGLAILSVVSNLMVLYV